MNSYKEEWITKSPSDRFFYFLQIGVWARAIMPPMVMLAILVAALKWDDAILFMAWPFLSFLWLLGGYYFHRKAEQDEIIASIERTKDPEYVNLLKQAGYHIYSIDKKSIEGYEQPESTETFTPYQASGASKKTGYKNALIITLTLFVIVGLFALVHHWPKNTGASYYVDENGNIYELDENGNIIYERDGNVDVEGTASKPVNNVVESKEEGPVDLFAVEPTDEAGVPRRP